VTFDWSNLGRHRSAAKKLGNALLAVRTPVEVNLHEYRMLAVTLVAAHDNLIGRHTLSFIIAPQICQCLNR
jgi:hypothetical protein